MSVSGINRYIDDEDDEQDLLEEVQLRSEEDNNEDGEDDEYDQGEDDEDNNDDGNVEDDDNNERQDIKGDVKQQDPNKKNKRKRKKVVYGVEITISSEDDENIDDLSDLTFQDMKIRDKTNVPEMIAKPLNEFDDYQKNLYDDEDNEEKNRMEALYKREQHLLVLQQQVKQREKQKIAVEQEYNELIRSMNLKKKLMANTTDKKKTDLEYQEDQKLVDSIISKIDAKFKRFRSQADLQLKFIFEKVKPFQQENLNDYQKTFIGIVAVQFQENIYQRAEKIQQNQQSGSKSEGNPFERFETKKAKTSKKKNILQIDESTLDKFFQVFKINKTNTFLDLKNSACEFFNFKHDVDGKGESLGFRSYNIFNEQMILLDEKQNIDEYFSARTKQLMQSLVILKKKMGDDHEEIPINRQKERRIELSKVELEPEQIHGIFWKNIPGLKVIVHSEIYCIVFDGYYLIVFRIIHYRRYQEDQAEQDRFEGRNEL